MNKTTKIIIIVAGLAAVAAFLIWRKKNSAVGTVDTGGTATGPDSVDDILTKIVFNSNERNAINNLRKKAENNAMTRQSLEAKANNNNLTYAQQLCCDAIWMLYIDTATGKWKDDRGWKLIEKIKNL